LAVILEVDPHYAFVGDRMVEPATEVEEEPGRELCVVQLVSVKIDDWLEHFGCSPGEEIVRLLLGWYVILEDVLMGFVRRILFCRL